MDESGLTTPSTEVPPPSSASSLLTEPSVPSDDLEDVTTEGEGKFTQC